jgi:hypothetical protein
MAWSQVAQPRQATGLPTTVASTQSIAQAAASSSGLLTTTTRASGGAAVAPSTAHQTANLTQFRGVNRKPVYPSPESYASTHSPGFSRAQTPGQMMLTCTRPAGDANQTGELTLTCSAEHKRGRPNADGLVFGKYAFTSEGISFRGTFVMSEKLEDFQRCRLTKGEGNSSLTFMVDLNVNTMTFPWHEAIN